MRLERVMHDADVADNTRALTGLGIAVVTDGYEWKVNTGQLKIS